MGVNTNRIITRGFTNKLVTRGFGRIAKTVIVYKVVPVCEPDFASEEYGERHVRIKELKPVMGTKPRAYYYEEIEE